MTNEEAKEILYQQWQEFLENNLDYAGISEAYKMAIKALSTELCEDCISRQAVLDTIEELKKIHFDRVVVLNKVCERVLELPPVTPKPKTDFEHKAEIVISQLRTDRDRLQETIKALGEDMRKCQKSITDEKALIGFNMALAICNKHFAESEEIDADSN